jgi:uncharacterized protein YyaL (SSP411 family)
MNNEANALIHETSPYLLQHARNPVQWFAWKEEVWQKAAANDKLVVVSIGYSACHWCHVMEHESFEDHDVAKLMNEQFINIKVDREERPDVDQIYMDAVQLISGRGGWPLNAICLPDGRPIYAGTYFPKENWKQVLRYFVHEYQTAKEKMHERAADITHGIRSLDAMELPADKTFTQQDLNTAIQTLLNTIDMQEGGRVGAPKFPMPINFRLLLENYAISKSDDVLQATTVTLDKMLLGGIYDQVGGGFARYSVDAYWQIPHFEKMLYDNAQLVSLYAQAYQATKDPSYKRIVYETLEFIERELTGDKGNFYSALDADSEGEEGKFYVWSWNELQQHLGNEFDAFCQVFDVSESGNFEGSNNLIRISKQASNSIGINKWRTKLLNERSKRIRPGLDDKTLTSWNALMLKGYVDAYNAFGEVSFLNTAIANANFIVMHQLKEDYSLLRNYKNNTSNISAFLDDYALVIDAFIALYESTFNEQWLTNAQNIVGYVFENFFDDARNIFFYTNTKDTPLIARKTETSDNVIPASNSIMAKNLYRLGLIMDNNRYTETAKSMLLNMKANALQHTSFYANWAALMQQVIFEPFVVAVCGSNALNIRKEFGNYFLPHCIFIGSNTSSKLPLLKDKTIGSTTHIYVCRNNTCGLPVQSVEDALQQMKG